MLVGVGDRVKEGIGVRCMEWIEPFNVGVILGNFMPPEGGQAVRESCASGPLKVLKDDITSVSTSEELV